MKACESSPSFSSLNSSIALKSCYLASDALSADTLTDAKTDQATGVIHFIMASIRTCMTSRIGVAASASRPFSVARPTSARSAFSSVQLRKTGSTTSRASIVARGTDVEYNFATASSKDELVHGACRPGSKCVGAPPGSEGETAEADVSQTQAVVDALQAAVNANEKVVIHCWGGVGRTGRLLGAYLCAQYGMSAEEAAAEVMGHAKTQGTERKVKVAGLEAVLPKA
eukprot:gene286-1622_t